MKDLLDNVLEASSQEKAVERFEEKADELREEAPDAVETFQDGLLDATAAWPCRTNITDGSGQPTRWNGLFRKFGPEKKPIRIFLTKDSSRRPSGIVGALLAEEHEERSTSRRYLKTDAFYEWLDEEADTEAKDVQLEPTNRTLQHA